MGGVVAREEVNTFGYELLINETKYEIKSNIVPIGRIRLGTYYHRALLFKVNFYLQMCLYLFQQINFK